MRLFRGQLYRFFLLGGMAVCCVLAAHSQATRTLNNVERRIDTMNRQAKDFERDNMARDAKTKVDAEAAKRTRQIRMEIEEDLKALQAIYNDAATKLQTERGLPLGFATETGRAVRKHAARLKTNLALPALDETDARTGPPPLPDTDRKTLTALCKVIYSFVSNPMFDGAGTLDVKNGTKARIELEEMIRIAEHLSIVTETETQ